MIRKWRSRFRIQPWTIAVTAGLATILYYSVDLKPASGSSNVDGAALRQATALIIEGMNIIHTARQELLPEVDFPGDLNQTGLIGLGWTPITTSGGNLEAKRTATDPSWGAVMVQWLMEAGVEPGDTVAAAFSGSFPGLNLAVLSAAHSLDLKLVSIASIGASSYGANLPELTWLDMERLLFEAAWPAAHLSSAASAGGSNDTASDLDEDGRNLIDQALMRSGLPILRAVSPRARADIRMDLYDSLLDGELPSLYINVGGSVASVGYCPDWFNMPSGLLRLVPSCPMGVPGVMQLMSQRNVPVLHLLNIRELAAHAGIPIDRRFELHQLHRTSD